MLHGDMPHVYPYLHHAVYQPHIYLHIKAQHTIEAQHTIPGKTQAPSYWYEEVRWFAPCRAQTSSWEYDTPALYHLQIFACLGMPYPVGV